MKLESRIEQGGLVCHPWAPFDLSPGELNVLQSQKLAGLLHKNISYSCGTGVVSGASDPRLITILKKLEAHWFSFLLELFPGYAGGMKPYRLVLNNTEAATRRIRLESRDDLLHFDIPPDVGGRILKCHWNLDQNSERIWAVGPPLLGFFNSGGLLSGGQPSLMSGPARGKPPWRQLHHCMKRDVQFQRKVAKTIWRFPSNSHWVSMTDGLIYGTLRGASVLEFHVSVEPEVLENPELSPEELWRKNSISIARSHAA